MLAVFLNLGLVTAHSVGAGNCDNAIPQTMPGGYLQAAKPWTLTGPTAPVVGGTMATLSLSGGSVGITYIGLSLYCENAAGTKVGSFAQFPANFHANSNCGNANEGLTHSDNTAKTAASFSWTTPSVSAPTNVTCKGIGLTAGTIEWQAGLMTTIEVVPRTAAPSQPTNPVTKSPTTVPKTAAPTPQGRTSSPTTAAPTQQGQTKAPTQQGQTNAPTPQGQTAAPTQQGQTAAPTQQGQTSAPTQQGQTAAPTPQGQTSAPTQQQAPTDATTNAAMYLGLSGTVAVAMALMAF